MAIQNNATKTALATTYKTNYPYGALFASSGPSTSGAATNEISGGSPAYARAALSWGTVTNGAMTSAATAFNVASGTTVTFFGVCASSTATTADVADFSSVTGQNFSSQGTYTVTATFAVT